MPVLQRTASVRAPTSGNAELRINYRTMSLRLEEEPKVAARGGATDPAAALRQITAHNLSPEDVCTRFSTHPGRGLDLATVARKATEGKNKISPPPTQYFRKGFHYVFGGFNALMWLAFILCVLSYKPLGGNPAPIFNLGVALLLLLVIIVSSTFYAIVDWNASRIMKAITGLVAEDAVVIRDTKRETISAEDLVTGDLVELTLGQRCPADMRIISMSPDCKFDRSLLTGESDPVGATIAPTSENALETRNLALMSTFLVQGSCTGIVFAIGDNSVMGRLVSMSSKNKSELTTIQKEIMIFTKIISGVAIGAFCISLIVWAVWLRTSYPGFISPSSAIINSIGCLTAFVPQGLPVCVALSLTIIAKRMSKRNVLVKNLATVETLGCMSILCSDKTGTLTEGKMLVQNVAFANKKVAVGAAAESEKADSSQAGMAAVQQVARLCNGAKFNSAKGSHSLEERLITGDPTDTAILRFAEGISDTDDLVSSHKALVTIPFNSKDKRMVSLVENNQSAETTLLVKGAPDRLFGSCTSAIDSEGNLVPFNSMYWANVQNGWAKEGQRVLALCRRSLTGSNLKLSDPANAEDQIEQYGIEDLTLVALLGLRDPPRPDVKAAVTTIREAHVRIFMVTGDFLATAVGIAKQVGIITNEHVETLDDARGYGSKESLELSNDPNAPVHSLAVEGAELETMSDEDWSIIVDRYKEIVFARTTPEQKLRIVEELKSRRDNTVAVTGDGVNDAPALQAADIGVAMGAGSDVAKDAAAIVLLNNDFASIPVAIENGRLVFDNLKKTILYLIPCGSYTEFMAVFVNIFLGTQIPMSSFLQVTFCLFNDVIMSISLMYEKPESDLMRRPPRNAKRDRLTNLNFFLFIYLWLGPQIWVTTMAMFFYWFQRNGFGFYDVILTFDKWKDGYKGRTSDELAHLVAVGQCIYYVTMVIMQYGVLLAVRNRRVSLFQSNPLWGPRRNWVVIGGMIGTVIVAIVVLYGPGLQDVFSTVPIPGMYWGLPFAFAVGILVIDETRKVVVRSSPKSFLAKIAW